MNDLSLVETSKALHASGYFKDVKSSQQAMVKVLRGRELGISPGAAMEGLFFVRDKLILSANLMASCIRKSGNYDYSIVKLTNIVCELAVTRKQQGDDKWVPAGTCVFTMEDAKLAGLATGDNWKKYPRNMLFSRAISNMAKWYCPDVFSAPVYLPDEIPGSGLEIDGDSLEIRKSAAKVTVNSGDEGNAIVAEVLEVDPTLLELFKRLDAPGQVTFLKFYGITDLYDLDDEQVHVMTSVLKSKFRS